MSRKSKRPSGRVGGLFIIEKHAGGHWKTAGAWRARSAAQAVKLAQAELPQKQLRPATLWSIEGNRRIAA